MSLDASAARLAAGFDAVADQLAQVRACLQDQGARLAELDRVLNGQRAQARVFDVVADAAQGVRVQIARACEVALPARVTRAAAAALTALDEIEGRTRMLDAVAMLSLITAGSLQLRVFDDYVRNLRDLTAGIAADATQAKTAVATLMARRRRAHCLFDEADRAMAEILATLTRFAPQRSAAGQAMSETIARVEAVASAVPDVLATETNALVQAIQFSDAAMQRLDHLRTILSKDDRGRLALGAAQIDALVAATIATVAASRASFGRIETAALEASRILAARDDGGAGATEQAMDFSRALLTALREASGQALDGIEDASGESTALADLAEAAATRFANLVTATDAIQVAAINAGLLSRSERAEDASMVVLAVDVQRQAEACARASRTCRGAIAQLVRSDDLGVFAAVTDHALIFRRSVSETARAIEAAATAMEDLVRLGSGVADSLRRLASAVATASAALQTITDSAQDLARLAAALPRDVPPGSGDMADLFDLYTMDAERAVHRALLGLPEAPPPAASRPAHTPEPGDDMLAAILF